VTLSPHDCLRFVKSDNIPAPTATIEILNKSSSLNVAYKIKTTAPKLFVVKPI
jgi:hypothetical protein